MILRLLLRLLRFSERLCRVKGRGTWAESARATSRLFATLLFLIFDFCFQLSSSSLSLSLSQSVHVHLLARARAKSEKRKARKAKSRPRFFLGSEKRIQSLTISLYFNFNGLRKDSKSLSLYLNFNRHILSPFVIT